MKLIKTALIAASLVGVAASASAQAQVLTNIHGGPAYLDSATAAAQAGVYSDRARNAYAQHPARVHRVQPHR